MKDVCFFLFLDQIVGANEVGSKVNGANGIGSKVNVMG